MALLHNSVEAMSSWTATTYKTKNWSNYDRALKQQGSLSNWRDAEMVREANCAHWKNDSGKTAIIDAIRYILLGRD
jgi:hypothetical protein